MGGVFVSGLKLIFVDLIGDIIYWPIWWYTVGLWNMAKFIGEQERKTWRMLALGIWLKNMFTPMFGDRSILGRLISFMMRVVILVWKIIWFVIWSVIILVIFLIWILAPVAVVWMIGRQFFIW